MKHLSQQGLRGFAAALTVTAMHAGCASTALQTEPTTSGIRAAEEVGAANIPKASLHLQLAKEELEHAEGLAKEGDDAEAQSLLKRAQADAELALALAREDAERAEAMEAMERVRKLHEGQPLDSETNPASE